MDHQVNGYLATPYDPEELAAGIQWCLKNNRDGHLSEAARRKVLENYTSKTVGRQYADLYARVSDAEHRVK